VTLEAIWTTLRRENPSPYRDSNSDPSVLHPVASCHTDCAIPAVNIILGLREIGGSVKEWFYLAQDREKWLALVKTVMNLWVP
jgi:hypothetical protein